MRRFYHFRMRQFYHFRREKRSVHSPNPLRAPAQSTAFSNRRFNRRAAQKRSSSDSAQPHLQNHAASASQLSMYKASCAGFTTLLRFGIKPCAALNSHASAQTYFKKHRRTKPLSIRFHASPALFIHPAKISQRRIHHAPSLRHQTCARPTPTHPRERPSKTIAAQNRSPFDFTQAQRCSSIPRKSPSAGFTAFLRFASNPAKPIQRPTIRTCSAACAGDYGQPERRRTKKPPHPIGCGG